MAAMFSNNIEIKEAYVEKYILKTKKGALIQGN